MSPRIGALFAGYGGLDLAVTSVFGGSMAWYSEVDKGALKILGHRFPDVPNVGDVTAADWSTVEPVDILTGGSPCQDLSHAGRRAGMTEGTRSNLWVAMREAIAQLRPAVVVWENVRGAYSAGADSAVEPCAGCVGDGSATHLRALGRVLGDLSDLGYDCRWHGLRAADIGAPHGRFRVFVVATDARNVGHQWARSTRGGWAGPANGHRGTLGLLPTPTARDWKNAGNPDKTAARMADRGQPLTEIAVNLLPTPAAQEPGGTLEQYHARLKAHDGRDSKFAPLSMAVQQLLPTPSAASPDSRRSDTEGSTYSGDGYVREQLGDVARQNRWGDYAAAIYRWELTLGRPAPAPTMASAKGNPQLSPAFVNWMMGLPAGWVDEVPGITRNEALKALGNGVVPQQAAAAIRTMLAWSEVAA